MLARKNASKFVPSQRTPDRPMTSIFGWCSAFKTRPEVSTSLRDRLFVVQPVTMSYYSRTAPYATDSASRLRVLGRLRLVFFLFFLFSISSDRYASTWSAGHVLRREPRLALFLSLTRSVLSFTSPTFLPSVQQKACKVSRGRGTTRRT